MSKWDKVDKAYEFLLKKEDQDTVFTKKELAKSTGWKEASVTTYIAKRWCDFIEKQGAGKYKSVSISTLSKEEFRDLHSQKLTKNSIFTNKIPKTEKEIALYKAREFAILAVSVYNNPTINLKTYGYIVNITIAWTALFHAIFEKNKIDYFYKIKGGKYKLIDGEKKAFELSECSKTFWKGKTNPVMENIKFLVGLRNKIEHRSLPELDFIVAGECQSCLTNFENMIVQEFGDEYSLNANLAISMQLSRISQKSQERAIKEFQSKNYGVIRRYIKDFQDGLTNDVKTSQEYRLSVFLVPKLKNHAKSSDMTIEFIKAEPGTKDEIEQYEKGIAYIKGDVESPYKIKPTIVVQQVNEAIESRFTMHNHTQARKKYKARPKDKKPGFKQKYCGWVEGHDDYLYTKEWVDFLILELGDQKKYDKLRKYKS